MEDFLVDILSLRWWLTVFVVGLLVNLFASYLKPRIDNILGFFSDRLRKRNAAKELEHQQQVELLSGDPHEQVMFVIDINYSMIGALNYFLFAALLILFILVMLLIIETYTLFDRIFLIFSMSLAVLTVLLGNIDLTNAHSNRRILKEARKAPTSGVNGQPSSDDSAVDPGPASS